MIDMIDLQWNIVRILVFVLVFILLLSVFTFYMSIRPPRYYDPATPAEYGIEYEDVTFKTSDGIDINAWLIKGNKSKGTVVIGHGYPFEKGNIIHVARFLYPEFNLLLYDHRYFGKSSGKITTVGMREVKDVTAAVDFVRQRFGKNSSVALYGFSLSASTMLMAQPDVSCIVADSPYSDLESMVKASYRMFGFLRYPFVKMTDLLSLIFFGVHPKNVSPAESVKGSKIPTLLIHGGRDSQIPADNSRRIAENNKDIELWIVEEADHGFAHALKKGEYEDRVRKFLRKCMK
jgi:dipeptidyl aminopeptidase/acylaminoacyl peptidase